LRHLGKVPKLHLTKVAFACRDSGALAARIAARAAGGRLRVATRMRPRRCDELLGGNLYWIVKHRVVACNEIRGFEDRPDGRIDIVCSAELKIVSPMHRRAHQGWRYLADAEAPRAEDEGSGIAGLPPRLFSRLSDLALV